MWADRPASVAASRGWIVDEEVPGRRKAQQPERERLDQRDEAVRVVR
jgi:hypothetical protein